MIRLALKDWFKKEGVTIRKSERKRAVTGNRP